MNASYFLMAAIETVVWVEILKIIGAGVPAVAAWATAKKWRHRINRKTGRVPSRLHGRLITLLAVSAGALLSAAALWSMWSGARSLAAVQGLGMMWVGLVLVVVASVGLRAVLEVARAFGTNTTAIQEHTEILTSNYENQRLLAMELKAIKEQNKAILAATRPCRGHHDHHDHHDHQKEA